MRHHRRPTFRGYLRQQYQYGRSERMVAGRHPHRFNRLGQARWRGFIYGGQRLLPRLLRPVIYHGVAGSAPFQPTRHRTAEVALWWISALLPILVLPAVGGLLLAPWYPVVGSALAGTTLLLLVLHAALVAFEVAPPRRERRPIAYSLLVGVLHVLQPVVRAWGRLRGPRLSPTEQEDPPQWRGERDAWIMELQRFLAGRGYHIQSGTERDGWDFRVSRLPLAAIRVTVAVAWRWLPAFRLRVEVRPLAILLFGTGVLLAASHPLAGAGVVVATLTAAALSVRAAGRAVRRAVASTTEGLAAGGEPR